MKYTVKASYYMKFYKKFSEIFVKREYIDSTPPASPPKKYTVAATWNRIINGKNRALEIFGGDGTDSPQYFYRINSKLNSGNNHQIDIEEFPYCRALQYILRGQVESSLLSQEPSIKLIEILEGHFIDLYLPGFDPLKTEDTVVLSPVRNSLLTAELLKAINKLEVELDRAAFGNAVKQYYAAQSEVQKIFRNIEDKYPALRAVVESPILLLPKFFNSYIDPMLEVYHKGRNAWGRCITLLTSQNLMAGWSINDIRFNQDASFFQMPEELISDYNSFLEKEFVELQLKENIKRIMVSKVPISIPHQPFLNIFTMKIRWSEIAYFHHRMQTNPSMRSQYLKRFFDYAPGDEIQIPNSLVLHLIVETSDGYFVFVKINNVGDEPSTWALTVGMQLDESDLQNSSNNEIVSSWVKNGLSKLNVEPNYDPANLRFMAFNLEGNKVNNALVAIVKLRYSKEQIEAILDKKFGVHKQFTEWKFRNREELLVELLNPSLIPQHSSTPIRIFHALMYKYGPQELERKLINSKF